MTDDLLPALSWSCERETLRARIRVLEAALAEMAAANLELRTQGREQFDLSAEGPFLPPPFTRQAT
jgi:hypothetical protein